MRTGTLLHATSRRGRAMSIFATLAVVAAALVAVAPSASAAALGGRLRIHGPGSLYAGSQQTVSVTVAAGAAAAFSLQVVNTGTAPAQFNLKMNQFGSPGVLAAAAGSVNITPAVLGPDGYYTALLSPGAAQTISLKITMPKDQGQVQGFVYSQLLATDNTMLDWDSAFAEIKAPTKGTTATDVFAKNGGQPYVGGSVDGQFTTAPAMKTTASAAFAVRLQNDSTAPAAIGFAILAASMGCNGAFPVTVKDGTNDITGIALIGNYVTPTLAPGAHHDLTVTIKYTNDGSGCTQGRWAAATYAGLHGALGHDVGMQADLVAT